MDRIHFAVCFFYPLNKLYTFSMSNTVMLCVMNNIVSTPIIFPDWFNHVPALDVRLFQIFCHYKQCYSEHLRKILQVVLPSQRICFRLLNTCCTRKCVAIYTPPAQECPFHHMLGNLSSMIHYQFGRWKRK